MPGGYLKTLSASERTEIARLGGNTILDTYGLKHFSEMGKKGGKKTSQNRARMAEIGRLGGLANKGKKKKRA